MSDSKFYHACCDGPLSDVVTMVEEGQDINTEYLGSTGLVGAIYGNKWDIASYLLTLPTLHIQWKNSYQWTYLHLASYYGAPVQVINTIIVMLGPELVNAVDNKGMTALEWAVKFNKPHVVECMGGRGEVAWDMGRLESKARLVGWVCFGGLEFLFYYFAYYWVFCFV